MVRSQGKQTGDRVMGWQATERLYQQAASKDKTLKLLDAYEHILLRKGHDAEDDERRQIVLELMLSWLEARRAQ